MAETDTSGKVKVDTDSVDNFNTVRRTLTAAAGTNTDKWAVPAGQSAKIKGVRANNPDASARSVKVEVLDASNNVVGALSNTGLDIISVPVGSAFVANPYKDMILPAGYQLQATWLAMTVSGALDWEVMYEDVSS
jgi:hypothetical protein